MRLLLVVVLVAAALWSGYWVFGARALEARLADWLAARRADGWVAEAAAIDVRGFPNRFDATLSEIELADPETGLAWRAPFFQLLALSYRPHHVIAVWPERQSFASPLQRIEMTSADMRASVVLDDGADLALDRSTFVLQDAALDSTAGWRATLGEARFATRRPVGSVTAQEVGVEVTDLGLGEAVVGRLDPTGALPRTIERLRLDLRIDFDAPWDRYTLEEARPQPTGIVVREARATWGRLDLRAAGELEIGPGGVPEGRITVKATNWREMLAVAEASGLLPGALSGTLESALGVLAGLSGSKKTLDVPLTFEGGRIRLGLVPLGPAPRLRLR